MKIYARPNEVKVSVLKWFSISFLAMMVIFAIANTQPKGEYNARQTVDHR